MKKILQPYRFGFTLVEMLMVIAVIALLAGMLLPTLSKSKEKGREMQSIGNARELSKAILMFSLDNKNRLPNMANDEMTNSVEKSSSGRKAVIDYVGGDVRVFQSPADRRSDQDGGSYLYAGTRVAGIDGVSNSNMTRIANSSAKAIAFEHQLSTAQSAKENQWYTITRRNGGGVIGFLDGHASMVKTNYSSPNVRNTYY